MNEINKQQKMSSIKKVSVAILIVAILSILISIFMFFWIMAETWRMNDLVYVEMSKSISGLVYGFWIIISSLFFFIIGIIQLAKSSEVSSVKGMAIASGVVLIISTFLMWVPFLGWGILIAVIILNGLIVAKKPEKVIEDVPEV